MKRIVALLVAVSVGLTLAPNTVASASSGDRTAVSASASANAERVAATSAPQPASFASAADRKKKCEYMCVQSTLPRTEHENYFINGNRHLISINSTGFTVRNLDSQKITNTQSFPRDITYHSSSLSQSGNKLIIVGGSDSGELYFYDVDLESFILTQIVLTDATHPLTTEVLYEFHVNPNGSGLYLVQQHEGAKYLCFFNALGAQVDCSDSFLGTSGISPIFFERGNDTSIYIMGNQLLFTFDTTDLTFSSVEIPVQLDTDGVMTGDGDMYFYDEVGPFDVGSETILYQLTTGGVLTNAYLFPALISFREIVVPSDNPFTLYLIGTPRKSDGTPQKYNTVYNLVDDSGTLELRKSFTVKPVRGQLPDRLEIDSEGRYLLASASGVKTSVIPADNSGSITIEATATYVNCPTAGWQIDWDFISFAPTKKVKSYALYYKGPDEDEWRKLDTLAAGGNHTTLFTSGVVGGIVKILPVGVRVDSHSTPILEISEELPSSIVRQPRC